MKIRLLSFCASCILMVPWMTLASTLTFRDLSSKDQAELKKTLPTLFSSPDLPTMDEAIRLLMKTNTYENVFLEKTGTDDYELIGKPLRTVQEIVFKGVKEVPESELRALIDFKVGDRFDRKRAVAAGEKMKTFYGEHGFFNTIIDLNFNKDLSGNIHLIFEVQEKPPCIIAALNFETKNTDLKALLKTHFKDFANKPLTTERIKQLNIDLQNLLVEHRYLAAEVVGPEAKYNPAKTIAYLQIEVREPYRYEFYFKGNVYFSTAEIYKILDLGNRERKNVDPPNEGAERLRKAYIDEGFPNVAVDTFVREADVYLRRTYYHIAEGARVKIQNIEVQGRLSRVSSYYKDIILQNSTDLISAGYFNRTGLDNGFKNLVTELRNQGFLRAKVQSSRIEYAANKKSVTVFLLLDEGPQTQIRGLDFKGNKFFSSFELAQVTGLETNTPLRLSNFEASLDKLKNFYRNQGFLEMKLLNEGEDLIQYNDKGTQARITFQIHEGARIRVNAIRVDGNTQTRTRVILQEADFKLGEVLTPQKLDDATARLNKMGLFARVDIRTLEEGTNIGERTLIISIAERDPGLYRIGGGVTSERNFTARGYTGASYNNLWGTARAISGRAELRENLAEVRYPESELTTGYLEPFLFNTRTRGRVNLTRSQYVADYETNFTQITIKNRVDFFAERDLTRHTKLTYKVWSLEARQDFERNGLCLPDPNNPTLVPSNVTPVNGKCPLNTVPATSLQVATIGPQIDIDYRDNPFLPTRGTFTRFTVDYSNPNLGSSKGVEFIRTDASHSWYTRLGSPRWVWANAIRGGYLSNLSRQSDSGVPADYAYILGGTYTVRGFDIATPNERIPKDGNGTGTAIFHLGETNEKLIRYDSFYYLVKTELRFPLFEDFGGVLFYDGGAVYISGYQFYRPYRDAVGFGFRYNTPVGPVALDFAFKINPDPAEYGENAEAPFRLNFSIGTF